MRLYIVITISILVWGVHAKAQEPEFPYTAIVLNDKATVHSGPGGAHYATHKLTENELVQVYRHDPDEWCMIRPPSKSFSLIPESAVKRLSKDVAEVSFDGCEAWVGTTLGPVEKPLKQVKLKKGERVAIVGEATWPHPSGKSVVWLQIEPPAGEYRWIRMSDLQLPPSKDKTKKEPARRSLPTAGAAQKVDYSEPPTFKENANRISSVKPSLVAPKFEQKVAAKNSGSGWKSATRPIPKTETEEPRYSGVFASPIRSAEPESGFVEQATFVQEEPADSRFEAWDGSSIPLAKPDPPERFASMDSMDRQVRSFVRDRSEPTVAGSSTGIREISTLIQIEDRLSEEILKEPRSWNLADLKFETERAKARSSDPVERLALQHVLEKIARCDKLRTSYQQASPFSATSSQPSSPGTVANTPYDATGWLKRLVSSSGSMDPTYVLQDSLGNVTHEIVGTTGMNLGQYVEKQVGVIGRRGFNQRLNLNHVTAERIVVRK